MNKCLIVSGGEFSPIGKTDIYDLVIACDKGYEHCLKMGIRPDIVLGDFDSYDGKIEEGIEIKKLNPIKDDTDTMSAVRLALEKGCMEIHICCAFGGRFDHSIANVQTALFIKENGADPIISGKGTALYCLKNETKSFSKKENCYISVFSISEVCRNVTISGTKYEIENAELTNAFPLGVSNEWKSENAEITIGNGTAVVIISENVKIIS